MITFRDVFFKFLKEGGASFYFLTLGYSVLFMRTEQSKRPVAVMTNATKLDRDSLQRDRCAFTTIARQKKAKRKGMLFRRITGVDDEEEEGAGEEDEEEEKVSTTAQPGKGEEEIQQSSQMNEALSISILDQEAETLVFVDKNVHGLYQYLLKMCKPGAKEF